MRCPQCNTENTDGSRFCRICGAPLAGQEGTQAGDAGAAPRAEAPVDTHAPANIQVPQARKIPVALVVVLVILAVGVTAFAAVFVYANVFDKPQEQVAAAETQQAQETPATQAATTEETAETQQQTEEAGTAQVSAHQQAIDDARAAGDTVVSGTVRVVSTLDELEEYTGEHLSSDFASSLASGLPILVFDTPTDLTGIGQSNKPPVTYTMTYLVLGSGWKGYEGQHIDCVVQEIRFPDTISIPGPYGSTQIIDDSGNLVSVNQD